MEGGLKEQDRKFKGLHYQLLELIDETEEGTLEREQRELDDHDDAMDEAIMPSRMSSSC